MCRGACCVLCCVCSRGDMSSRGSGLLRPTTRRHKRYDNLSLFSWRFVCFTFCFVFLFELSRGKKMRGRPCENVRGNAQTTTFLSVIICVNHHQTKHKGGRDAEQGTPFVLFVLF